MNLHANTDMLAALAGQDWLYCPNPGNAGDSLIACATYLAFARAGLRYTTIGIEAAPSLTRGRWVIYGGGGNLVGGLYRTARSFIERHHEGAARLVVLPHTIRGNEDLLQRLGPNVHLFCRDDTSLQHVRSCAAGAQVAFAHDMALTLDLGRLADLAAAAPALPSPYLLAQGARLRLRMEMHRLRNRSNPSVLHAYRTDRERTGSVPPGVNFDVSQQLAVSGMQANAALLAATAMVHFISRFEEVHTDRLHVGIVALLLGKRVYLHDNSYGKNSAVYRSSLQQHFAGLTLLPGA